MKNANHITAFHRPHYDRQFWGLFLETNAAGISARVSLKRTKRNRCQHLLCPYGKCRLTKGAATTLASFFWTKKNRPTIEIFKFQMSVVVLCDVTVCFLQVWWNLQYENPGINMRKAWLTHEPLRQQQYLWDTSKNKKRKKCFVLSKNNKSCILLWVKHWYFVHQERGTSPLRIRQK